MITDCAACAAKLAHDAPRCVRCKTKYCNAMASDFTRLSPEDQALFPGLATGFAAGISCPKTKKGFEEMMRAAQQGNPAAKAPSIKEMKATIRKAGFGVADLVEKSDVVKRYQEALARLGTA